MLKPLFGIEPPDWTERPEPQMGIFAREGDPEPETEKKQKRKKRAARSS